MKGRNTPSSCARSVSSSAPFSDDCSWEVCRKLQLHHSWGRMSCKSTAKSFTTRRYFSPVRAHRGGLAKIPHPRPAPVLAALLQLPASFMELMSSCTLACSSKSVFLSRPSFRNPQSTSVHLFLLHKALRAHVFHLHHVSSRSPPLPALFVRFRTWCFATSVFFRQSLWRPR